MNQNLSWVLVGLSIIVLLIIQYTLKLSAAWIPVLAVITLLLSIFLVVKASDYTVSSIRDYAHKTRLPHFLVGFVIISLVTVLPDTFTGVFVSQAGMGQIIIGDALAALMIDLVLLVALAAIITKKLPLGEEELKGSTTWIILSLSFLPLLLFLDGELSRPEALLLLVVFAFYLTYITRKEVSASHIVKSVAFRSIWKDIIIFGVNVSVLILGARWLAESARIISDSFGLAPFLVGFLILAFGNSLPEIAFTVRMARKGVTEMSLGNSFGSVMVDIFVVWGIAALIRPLRFSTAMIATYAGMLVIIAGMVYLLKKKAYLTRKHGIILLGIYLVFAIANVWVHG